MENNKEQTPKFYPEFSYLENPEILELQRVFDDIVMDETGNKDARMNKISVFQEGWMKLLQKYSEMAKTDDSHLRQLIKFFRDNLHMLDKGGMLLGRSEIGILMSEENRQLFDQYANLIEEMEKNKAMKNPENTNQPPFKENLVDFPARAINSDVPEGYPVLFKQFENNPEKIVKISRKENIYRFTGENYPVESHKSLEIQKKSKEHYSELSNKYNIAVTQPEYVIGKDEDGKESVVYSVSDRIHGDNLLEKIKDFKSDEDIKELENLLISLMDYFEDKFNNDNYYLGDVGNLGNYMYGRRKGEDKDKIYLVDVEPVLNGLDSSEKRNFFYSRIKEVFYPQIEHAEKETGLTLSETRKRYSDFIKNIEKKL